MTLPKEPIEKAAFKKDTIPLDQLEMILKLIKHRMQLFNLPSDLSAAITQLQDLIDLIQTTKDAIDKLARYQEKYGK